MLWTAIDKLDEPEMDKHGSFMHVEPQTGMILNFSRRYQVK